MPSLSRSSLLNAFKSPRWLIKRGNDEAAIRAMTRLTGLSRDDPELHGELDEVRLNLQHEQELGESSYLDCFKPSKNRIALRTWTGIALQAWQQVCSVLCRRRPNSSFLF